MADKTKSVVTRFAPSPTGMLHIGGARTALFNWLYTKHTGGKFLLRIEDTDRERSKQEHVDAILGSLRWLGLDWDGEPFYQAARADRHREVAQKLLADGKAYHCYLTPEDLDAMRKDAEAKKLPLIIRSPWRDRDPSEAPKDVKPALRLKAQRDGETVIEDAVQGRVVFPNKDLDDMVILRANGTPIYNFAVVVDDHDMGVTHIVRGVDHLTNAARQSQVYSACGWETPVFAHIPLVHGADGAKLSKRHGAQGVEELARAAVAALRLLRQRAAERHVDGHRQLGFEGGGGRRRRVQDLAHQVAALAGERTPAAEHLVDDDPGGVDVGALGHDLARQLLRRLVRRRAGVGLRARVRVREVGLDAADLGHRQHARSDRGASGPRAAAPGAVRLAGRCAGPAMWTVHATALKRGL